ncbi:uncharacterized protein, partial [Henckelia pumila]|uniref:uncharacterized protein n=1 Tax=Henckelia pumila TaxID=405737 RepID=UPI003C6DD05C
MYHSVIRLQIHLPNEQLIRFNSEQSLGDILANDDNSNTMLTEFFKMNSDPTMIEKYLYREFPQHYAWIQSAKKWMRRRNQNKVVGRIYVVSPYEGDRFYLRILLNHVKGPSSFEELRKLNGITYTTFKEATEMRDLLQQDDYIRQCLQEACSSNMPSSLRRLFVSILVFCQPIGVRELWNEFNLYMSEDYGGTGKTFLYRSILAQLRKNGKIAITVATFGIAATLVPGGRTTHSRLQIPLRPTASTLCKINKQSDLAELIRRATTVVCDEAPMANRYAFEAVSQTFQDIMDNQLPFGGKTIIFGGDFRQVLPVVKRGPMRDQIAASISRSSFWNSVKILHLQQNMRSAQDIEFSQFLLRVGDGLEENVDGNFIKLPNSMIIPWESENSIQQLIDSVFPNMSDHVHDANYMVDRAIITTKNVDVDEINEILILKFPGEEKVYTSWDSIEDDNHNLFQEEFLNSLCPSGLPPHRITLKVGCPIMLLRNVAPELGLCNGTRLICRNLGRNFINAEIITGPHKGDIIKLKMQFNTDATRNIQFMHVDAITIYQQNVLRLNAMLHMKDIAKRRQMEETKLFRKKIRPANDIDIKT